MRWTGDVTRGAWLKPRLSGWASRDAIVPGGFAAYARIFHPGVRYWWDGPANRPGSTRLEDTAITWAQVAALTGTTAHPWMQWGAIARWQTHEGDLNDGTSADPPEDGRLPRDVLEPLLPLLTAATTTPDDITAAVWEGWGALHSVVQFGWFDQPGSTGSRTLTGADLGVAEPVTHALDDGRLLQLPSRNYLLFEGALSDLTDPGWAATAGLGHGMGEEGVAGPQLLWPTDHAWCLATEIDCGFTLLAGSTALIQHALAQEGIEVAVLDHDGDLSWDGDTLNPKAYDR